MLTMSFVYFNIWQIKQNEPKDFEKGLIGFGKDIEKELLAATSPFVFSTVNERSILRLLKLIQCDNGKIGTYAKLVDDHNETAHPSGNIFYSEPSTFDSKLTEILRVVDEIQTHSKPVIEHCYCRFLLDNHDSEEREYPEATDEICLAYDVAPLKSDPNFPAIEALHQTLRTTYSDPEAASVASD
jgi:hypothetical protein